MIRTRTFTPLTFVLTFLLSLLPFSAHAANQSVSFNVFAIPSQPIIDLVQETSEGLKKQGITSFYEKGFPVHATLYLTDYPQGSEQSIKQAVAKVVARFQAFPIQAQGFTVTQSQWAFIDISPSGRLQRLADEITLALEPMRNQQASLPTWVKNFPNKLAAFKRYGSPNVFQNFQPHLTLLANETSPKLAAFHSMMKTHPPMAKGQIIGVGIGISDQWGQQKEVIAHYYFK
ncbi:2'-5' RNA ligase family protein [Marinomonas pollencensis]|uniref:2'-5' RNA ligase n=1 Tax=Marinomonas pollencensis TaxID=491954 RepID=A0A3E0DND7_9GAMM|nr:2'-5' RNA ligase family protein [Marinomonas pollencensis]REG84340.1 2'-5' RNA ligase [Marinomonas pollencensis]